MDQYLFESAGPEPTQKQLQLVTQLKLELSDQLSQFPDLQTTWRLLRFCTARDFSYPKTKQMLGNCIAFRKKTDFTRLMQLSASDFQLITDNYCRGYCGTDYEGRVVMIEKISWSNPQIIHEKVSTELLRDYFVSTYERLVHVIFPIA